MLQCAGCAAERSSLALCPRCLQLRAGWANSSFRLVRQQVAFDTSVTRVLTLGCRAPFYICWCFFTRLFFFMPACVFVLRPSFIPIKEGGLVVLRDDRGAFPRQWPQ